MADRGVRQAGTTLMEMLVVLAILCLLAGLAAPEMSRYFALGQMNAGQAQIATISASLNLFRADVGRFPSTAEGLTALLKRPGNVEDWGGPYVRAASALMDPWGRPFVYRSDGSKTYELFTRGPMPGASQEKAR